MHFPTFDVTARSLPSSMPYQSNIDPNRGSTIQQQRSQSVTSYGNHVL